MPPEVGSDAERREWLARHSPAGWIQQGLTELNRAQERLKTHDLNAGLLGLRRAAGMALNGALAIDWRPWGRTYVEHLQAIVADGSVPDAVRRAARTLNEVTLDHAPNVVRLTPPSESARWVDAAKTVMAHAYAVVHGSVGRRS
jgi:hypothetical protein